MKFNEDELAPSLVKEGPYMATIRAAREIESRGRTMVLVDLTLDEGHEVTDFFVLSGVSADALKVSRPRLKRFLQNLGIELSPGKEVDLSKLEGARVEVVVTVTKVDGQPTNGISKYRRLPA